MPSNPDITHRWYAYILSGFLAITICGLFVYYKVPIIYSSMSYVTQKEPVQSIPGAPIEQSVAVKKDQVVVKDQDIPVTHIATPHSVKALYSSAWVAGLPKYRDPLITLLDTTELNSIVIDVKDSTGRIGFSVQDPTLATYRSAEKRIPNIHALTNMLHAKGVYIIGRVAVFQDPYMTHLKPEWSLTKKSDGTVWKDHKGLSFLDPTKHEVWDYTVAIAREAYNDGFDEINFDYVRYPSDGDVKNINYHIAKGETRSDNLEKFFAYLHTQLKHDPQIMMSADLFGLTTESTDDMGIGQVWEKALPYFDFIAPMVYPSHYPPGQDGFANPAEHPYEIINKALAGAVAKTQKANGNSNKIRPWLQDFNLGAKYTGTLIKAEMKAVYDNKLTSWMLWDPKNKYTRDALSLEN